MGRLAEQNLYPPLQPSELAHLTQSTWEISSEFFAEIFTHFPDTFFTYFLANPVRGRGSLPWHHEVHAQTLRSEMGFERVQNVEMIKFSKIGSCDLTIYCSFSSCGLSKQMADSLGVFILLIEMKVKAGVSQLEEAAALPASVHPLACFDIELGDFVHDFWAIRSTMQEGLGSSHLVSPIEL